MEQQKIDLDALEAAYEKANLPDTMRILSAIIRLHPHATADACSNDEDEAYFALAHNALPALIAELRQLRARVTPEPIGDKHKDGNWWMMWEPGYEQWLKLRWRYEGWRYGDRPLYGTPTHALPMPPAPEEI